MSDEKHYKKIRQYKVVVMCGVPGSGKSYWARKLHQKLAYKVFSSDEFRKKLFGTDRFDLLGHEKIKKQSKLAYERMYAEALDEVRRGTKVVLDATHMSHRGELLRKIREVTDSVVIVVVKTSEAIQEKRMKQKSGRANSKETYLQAWRRVYGYYQEHFEKGEYSYPDPDKEQVDVIEIVDGKIKTRLAK